MKIFYPEVIEIPKSYNRGVILHLTLVKTGIHDTSRNRHTNKITVRDFTNFKGKKVMITVDQVKLMNTGINKHKNIWVTVQDYNKKKKEKKIQHSSAENTSRTILHNSNFQMNTATNSIDHIRTLFLLLHILMHPP